MNRIKSVFALSISLLLVSCGEIANDADKQNSVPEAKNIAVIQEDNAGESPEDSLTYSEQEVYDTIKAQLPDMQEDLKNVGYDISACTVSSAVYTLDGETGEISAPEFYLIGGGEVVAAIYFVPDDQSQTVNLEFSDFNTLTDFLGNGKAFLKISGSPSKNDNTETTMDGIYYSGYYCDGDFHIEGLAADSFDVSSVDIAEDFVKPIYDLGEKVRDMVV